MCAHVAAIGDRYALATRVLRSQLRRTRPFWQRVQGAKAHARARALGHAHAYAKHMRAQGLLPQTNVFLFRKVKGCCRDASQAPARSSRRRLLRLRQSGCNRCGGCGVYSHVSGCVSGCVSRVPSVVAPDARTLRSRILCAKPPASLLAV